MPEKSLAVVGKAGRWLLTGVFTSLATLTLQIAFYPLIAGALGRAPDVRDAALLDPQVGRAERALRRELARVELVDGRRAAPLGMLGAGQVAGRIAVLRMRRGRKQEQQEGEQDAASPEHGDDDRDADPDQGSPGGGDLPGRRQGRGVARASLTLASRKAPSSASR